MDAVAISILGGDVDVEITINNPNGSCTDCQAGAKSLLKNGVTLTVHYPGSAGVEAVIGKDFILKEADIKELVKAFLDEEPFSNRFGLAEGFFGFHPEMTKKYLDENG